MQKYAWGHPERYNDFQSRFRELFPDQKIQKISVNSGFTCPNRDGSKGVGGCTYCNNAAFTPYFSSVKHAVSQQLETGIGFFSRKYPEMKYLAYFQSYSNTYAPVDMLRGLYEEALSFPGVVGLVVATRPDCLDDGKLDYLASLSQESYFMLEIGMETHLDKTLERINRCHSFEDTLTAIGKAAERKLRTTLHTILGLPGETREDWLDQARVVSGLPAGNLKLHQFQIHNHTLIAREYQKNPVDFHLFSLEEYLELLCDYLELLDPRITVERFTSQAPPDILIAPAWGVKNHEFAARLIRTMEQRNSWQGKYHREQG